VRVAHNGIDEGRIFPLERGTARGTLAHMLDPASPFILTVGQGAPYKNHLNAVRGFLAAFADRPEYRMVLVWRRTSDDKELNALLREPGVAARVVTLGYVTPELLNSLYNAARIVLHPSYYEGFGLPLIEAMRVGVPVVTSSVSSMPEVAGKAAVLVDPSDVTAIATALARLDSDEGLRESLISEGHERLKCFSWNACARTTLDVYREIA
jgi:glycosyltransferase involved in cell wall biosynthesis